MKLLSTLALPLLASLSAATAAAQAGCNAQVLTSNSSAPVQWFGTWVLNVDGEIFVSANQDANAEGRVYVFREDPTTGLWGLWQILAPSVQGTQMRFGVRLTHDDGVLVVTGPFVSGGFEGGAFVFEKDPSTDLWIETQVLTEAGSGFYGTMAELNGNRLAITDAWANGMGVGRVYLYRRDPALGRFVREATVDSFEAYGNNRFADSAVFLDEDTLLLADANATVGSIQRAGRIRILERNPATGSWDQTSTIDPPTPSMFGTFGGTMEWDGRQLVVSEPREDDVLPAGGATHVYEPNPSGGWTLVQTLRQRAPSQLGLQYGVVRDLTDGQLWIFHSQRDSAGAWDRRIDRWLRDDATGQWRLVGEITNPLQTASPNFGDDVAVDGSTVVVGESQTVVPGQRQGRAFVFDLSGCDELGLRYCDPATPNSTGAGAELAAFGTVFTQHEALAVRATNLPAGAPSLLLASRTTGSSLPANSVGRLCLSGSFGRFPAVLRASDAGSVNAHVDTSAIPTPSGPVAIQPGDTWNLQMWYRDSVGSQSTSNFTSAVQIAFQ